jgi:hypothetical protein
MRNPAQGPKVRTHLDVPRENALEGVVFTHHNTPPNAAGRGASTRRS